MGDNKKSGNKSRRSFFSLFLSGNNDSPSAKPAGKGEMVKMMTADGKIVEVEKSIADMASKKQRSTNKQIFDWMKNPSKDDS